MSEPVEVDVDLLADYVGGALEGTPEHERVAALVATDPAWGREHELLVVALAATADDLATFAQQTAQPMPDEVLARLLAALPESATAGPARSELATGWRSPSDSAAAGSAVPEPGSVDFARPESASADSTRPEPALARSVRPEPRHVPHPGADVRRA